MIYEDFLAQFTDWRPTTLYWQRFSIAEGYGKQEISSIYEGIFKEAKKNYKKLTELVMILNHKCWQHCENNGVDGLCETYSSLFYETREYAINHLSGDELQYFFDITD